MKPTTLFLDVGGVLGTNGWDRAMRQKAADQFHLDIEDMNERHHLTFDTYEVGKLSLSDYLDRVVFHCEREFTKKEFREFLFSQSTPFRDTIDYFKRLKSAHHLKITVVSNEGRELMAHRIDKFGLGSLVDSFVVSSFVHLRKPDADIYRLALDITQVSAPEVLYVDDRALFTEVARGLGIPSFRYAGLDSLRSELTKRGL